MANEIYLVRHGDYDWDGSLSEQGIAEIKTTASRICEELSNLDGLVVYHSPVQRARESGEIMASELGVEAVESEDLRCGEYSVSRLVYNLRKNDSGPAVLISHQPDLEDFMSSIRRYSRFRTGGFHRL